MAKRRRLRDPLKDALVQVAMNYVGMQVGEVAATGLNAEANMNRGLYFLWSVERVGMIYSVPRMGGVDWYHAGAAAILRAQLPDGTWAGRTLTTLSITADINTCFALLFLRKSNFARDLTANLKNKPHQTTIRSGGEDAAVAIPPPAVKSSAAERLARELPNAAPERQDAILNELREGKGGEFTDSLARIIPSLTGTVQKKARDVLAERLARMNAATLRTKLKDQDAEVRRATALASP